MAGSAVDSGAAAAAAVAVADGVALGSTEEEVGATPPEPEVRIHLTVMPHYSEADGHTLRVLRRQGSAVSVSAIIRDLHRSVTALLLGHSG